MIAAVTLMFYDHEPSIVYVDSNLLQDDFIDSELKNAISNHLEDLEIDASDWEEHPEKFPVTDGKYPGEIGITSDAIIDKPEIINVALIMKINFDC